MALPTRLMTGQVNHPFWALQPDLHQLLGALTGSGTGPGGGGGGGGLAPFGVDVREDEDHYYVEVDLPGFRRDDVDIALENGTLTILAERHEEPASDRGDGARRPGNDESDEGTQSKKGRPRARAREQNESRQAEQGGAEGDEAVPQQQQQEHPAQHGGEEDSQDRADRPRQQRRGRGQGNYLLRERHYERFVRSLTLPPNVDERQVRAELRDGCLTITLDKKEESKPRRIPIT